MKVLSFILLFCACISCRRATTQTDRQVYKTNNQPIHATGFEDTLKAVVVAFNKRDTQKLTALIPQEGLILLYRSGVFNEFKRIDKIDFTITGAGSFQYHPLEDDLPLKYEPLPKFNCGSMEWNKTGLYCDTIQKNTLLSATPLNLRKYRGDKIAESEIILLKQLENKSRRIILADKGGADIIFYLTLINNRWYLTAIDQVTTDCSA